MRGPKAQNYDPRRFEVPDSNKDVQNPYDMTGPVIDDLIRRKINPVSIQTISLATAGTLFVNNPGRALVMYGHDGSSKKTVNSTAFIEVQFEIRSYDTSVIGFPMKHARGFRGPFSCFAIQWPAQPGIFADLVIHQFEGEPWIDGETCT